MSSVAFGTLANAAFVGAKTVNIVVPDSSSASPACLTNESRVESCGVFAATPAMVGDASSRAGAAVATGTVSARAARTVSAMRVFMMWFLSG